VQAYGIRLNFGENLTAIDGESKRATFTRTGADGVKQTVVRDFDLIHVVPPQVAPDFLRSSPLADAAGWVDVDPASLRHRRYDNIFGLGDACNTTNAKTAAATRKQAPVVAHNLLAQLGKALGTASYDGYGGTRQDRPGRVQLWRQACAELPALADRRHQTVAPGLAPEKGHPSATLLGVHA
jgi:sulfide:quinone oxidoreductase